MRINFMSSVNLKIGVLQALFGAALLIATQAFASAVPVDDPVKLIDHITSEVMQELKTNKEKLTKDPEALFGLLNKSVIPYVDFVEMSTWIAGKSAWHASTAAEQQHFIKEFKNLLLRTYATALNKYTDETIEVYPLAQEPSSQKRVQVSSKVLRANQENIKIDYRLLKADNKWNLYDVIIEGVSILKGFQAQFSDEIKHKGLEHATKLIIEHAKQQQNNENK